MEDGGADGKTAFCCGWAIPGELLVPPGGRGGWGGRSPWLTSSSQQDRKWLSGGSKFTSSLDSDAFNIPSLGGGGAQF